MQEANCSDSESDSCDTKLMRFSDKNPKYDEATRQLLSHIQTQPELTDSDPNSQISSFYTGKTVFITGASGFVGKCLLEKLLRSCPSIKMVFILMRPKRGLEVGERVDNLLRGELFDRLRSLNYGNEQLDKVRAIKGDITRPQLGISDDDLSLLRNAGVSIVFHSAATVKFEEPLKIAVENNVCSVNNLVEFVQKIEDNLEALVHVSTAYSNCNRKCVAEAHYESPIDPERLIEMSQWMEPDMFEQIAPTLIGDRPNSYTYTKAVAESLLIAKAGKQLSQLPIAMVRPSIVAGIWREPIRGWVDNFNGPTGVILALTTGCIKGMHVYADYCADIVPVDMVANMIICAGWKVVEDNKCKPSPNPLLGKLNNSSPSMEKSHMETLSPAKDKITIFNCVSGTLNPVTWRDFSLPLYEVCYRFPCNKLMRLPSVMLIRRDFAFKVFNFFCHTTFAYAIDFVLGLLGKKQTFVSMHNRLMKMIKTLKPFTTNQWQFECSNVINLHNRMSPLDQQIFNFDIRQVKWEDYFKRYYIGSKIFALKDDPCKIVAAKRKLRTIRIGSKILQLTLALVAYFTLISGSSIEKLSLNSTWTFVSRVLNWLVSNEHQHYYHDQYQPTSVVT